MLIFRRLVSDCSGLYFVQSTAPRGAYIEKLTNMTLNEIFFGTVPTVVGSRR